MHPATLLVRPETPRFERSAALPSSPPPSNPASRPGSPLSTIPCPSGEGSYQRRDEMKPSISVIAAERRFFAFAENASSGKRSPIPLPIAFLRLPGSL